MVLGAGEAYGDSVAVLYSDVQDGVDNVLVAADHGQLNILRWGDGNIDADPLFLDPNNRDYRLTENSPCIDAGDPDSPPDPDGTRADMGAFYFHQRDIDFTPDSLAFDTLFAGESRSLTVALANIGRTTLTIRELRLEGAYYSRDVNAPFEIAPDSSRELTVTFAPEESGAFAGSLAIISDDPDEDTLVIPLSGFGKWFEVSAPSDNLPTAIFKLHSPSPNPFNSTTTIRFSVGAQGLAPLRLAVYGLDGKLVSDLLPHSRFQTPNSKFNTVVWNAEGLPAGVYLIRLEAGREVGIAKAVLMK